MTRLAEDSDSDGEFPNLKDLLNGVKGKADVGRVKVCAVTRAGRSIRRNGKGKESDLGGAEEEVHEDVREKVVPRAVERSVKKKRVLGKRDDNPLLRPITKSAREEHVRTTSTLFDAGSETSRTKSVKYRKMGEGRSAKAAPVEVDEPAEELATRLLKVKAMKQRLRRIAAEEKEPSLELKNDIPGLGNESKKLPEMESLLPRRGGEMSVTAIEPKPQATKPKEGKTFTGMSKSRSIIAKVSSEKEHFGTESESEHVSEVDVATSKEDRETSTELWGTGNDSDIKTAKPYGTAAATETVTAKTVTIIIDSEDDDSNHEEPKELPASAVTKPRRRRDPPPRTKSKFILTDTEDEDSLEDEDSDGMSDFIVSDHESVEGDDSLMEIPPPPPRSARKLVKGRRLRMSESEDEGLDLKLERLTVNDDDVFGAIRDQSREPLTGEDEYPIKHPTNGSRKAESKFTAMKPPPRKEREVPPPSSNIEDPFTLRFSPTENKRKVSKEIRFTTPPTSPKLKPRALPSPTKLPRIPTSPHRQSSDAFWSQDIINDWNDEYSPRKMPKPTLKPLGDGTLLFSSRKSPIKPHRLTKDAKKAFSRIKHDLAESFLKELDDKITDGKISEMAESTGGVKIVWSKKLNTTAGRANWKRETIHPKSAAPSSLSSSIPATLTFRHHAAIELAEKVIDDEDRLLNVIAHEFCHLANFMVSNIRTNPHGKEFKAWASEVSRVFGDRGIGVTTKHSYEIEYKYVWECENCGTEFKRHSKSIDPGKHRCGVCKYKLAQTRPVPRGGDGKGVPNEYQTFVKENMKLVREENPGSPQKEIMGLVGKRYQEYKASKLREGSMESGSGMVYSKEGTPADEDEVGDVVRKLDILDLTSP